jgi:hypothetical protein
MQRNPAHHTTSLATPVLVALYLPTCTHLQSVLTALPNMNVSSLSHALTEATNDQVSGAGRLRGQAEG